MENITTGNWKADRIIQGHVAVGKLLVASAHCGTTHSSSVGIDAKEMLANAHLIAAAPKMYESIESSLKKMSDSIASRTDGTVDDSVMDEIRASFKEVLAKARGEVPESDQDLNSFPY